MPAPFNERFNKLTPSWNYTMLSALCLSLIVGGTVSELPLNDLYSRLCFLAFRFTAVTAHKQSQT